MPKLCTLLSGVAACTLVLAVPGHAETLRGALAKAYESNPDLTAARAGQRALDENEPIVRAGGLPSVGTSGTYSETVKDASPGGGGADRVMNLGTSLRVPLYSGGAVRNGVRSARARIEAGRADLRTTETDVFAATVAAYMDVIRDEAIVALNRNNVAVLSTNLSATRDRFEIGDLTRTDVAQSQARLALARAQMQSAEAQLIASRERYVRVVGEAPVDLEAPPALPGLPATTEDAVAVALKENPQIEMAAANLRAARYDTSVARAGRMPEVAAVANGGYVDYLGSATTGVPNLSADQRSTSASAGLQVSFPLFQGGAPSARVRQAQARTSQAIEAEISVERGVIAQTRAFYASWSAAQQVIVATEQAVSANALSLEGVRAENSVGTRSILEILNAEQELLDSQVRLVTAKRDAYVAGFNLLAMMGMAESRSLGLESGALYDPVANYQRVRRQIWDWADDPAPVATGTRTTAVPAQSAAAPDLPPAATVPMRDE